MSLTILIQNDQFKNTQIFASPNDSIATLKEKYYQETNIPSWQQRLVLFGKTLENDRTLQDYNIKDFTTINLVMRGNNLANQQPNTMTVFVKKLDGKKIEIKDILSGVTMSYIKSRTIECKDDPPVESQHLFLDNLELANEKQLGESKIPNGSTLVLKLKINIKPHFGKKQDQFEMFIVPTQRVNQLKQQIYCLHGTPPEQQFVIYNSKRMKDTTVIDTYDIETNSILHLYHRPSWNIERIIWVGFFKNTKNDDCFLAQIPKDVVFHLLLFV